MRVGYGQIRADANTLLLTRPGSHADSRRTERAVIDGLHVRSGGIGGEPIYMYDNVLYHSSSAGPEISGKSYNAGSLRDVKQ